jgi:O-antigen/teichoic acid export membrane protein
MKTATDNALLNFSSNTLFLVITAGVSLWMTPYLIGKLGIEVYGVVPLFTSMLGYLGLLTMVLSSSVARYVSLYYYKGNIDRANTYLSSAFWGLISICSIVFVGAAAFSPFLDNVFNVPAGYESQSRGLFLLVIAASLIAAINSLYGRSCFILHKFYWLDLFSILSKFLQVAVVVLCFTYLSTSLMFVGWGVVAASLFALLLTATLDMFILPELKINYGRFDWTACKEMIAMGAGVSINQFGSLLYLNSDLIVINIFLGSTATGQYGPIVQWAFLIRMLAGVVTRLFGPMVMELIAKQDFEALKYYLFTLIKFLGLILGLPICLVCGFSKPLLSLWLGDEFVGLYKLMILLVLGQIVPYSLGTIFAIFKGLNTLKVPGIVTLIAGVGNIILSIILVKYTPLGIYGAGIGTIIAVFGKGVLFNVLYLSRIMKFNPWNIWLAILKGCSPAVIFTVAMFLFSRYIDLNHLMKLMLYGALFGAVYTVAVYRIVLNKADRQFALRVSKLDKILSPRLVAIITK